MRCNVLFVFLSFISICVSPTLADDRFDILMPKPNNEGPSLSLRFIDSSGFTKGCSVCRNISSWTFLSDSGYTGQGCHPECVGSVRRFSFKCYKGGLVASVLPFKISKQRKISKKIKIGGLAGVMGDQNTFGKITGLKFGLRDFDGLMNVEIYMDYSPNWKTILDAIVDQQTRKFTVRIGKNKYRFNMDSHGFLKRISEFRKRCSSRS